MSAASQPKKLRGSWYFLLARWAAAALVLGILLYLLPVAPLRTALARVPLTRFVSVLLIYLFALSVGIIKWHTVVNTAGAQLRFVESAQCYTSGLFGDLFLPSVIGGDVARLTVGISPAPGRGHYRKRCRPPSRLGGSTHARFGRFHVASRLFTKSAASARAARTSCGAYCVRSSRFVGVGVAPAAVAGAIDSSAAPARASATCGSHGGTAPAPTCIRLAAGNYGPGHIRLADRAPRSVLWTRSAATGVAVCLAPRENCRRDAHHAGRHRSSRGGVGGAARAVWSTGVHSACHWNCLGGRHHRGRTPGGIDGIPLAVGGKSLAALLAFL
jgi:Lysylphosphatidylglycerol synthase TM region